MFKIYGDNSDFDIILRRNMTEKGEACNTLFDGYKVKIFFLNIVLVGSAFSVVTGFYAFSNLFFSW